MNAKQKEQHEAVRELREILKPGDTVFTKLISVSRSGMSRVIMPLIIRNNEPQYLDWKVAKATGYTLTPTGSGREGVKIGGCGMDMGFALVYDLSRILFPDGFNCIGPGCPASCHVNGDRDYTPGRHHDGDGGYALKHRWF